MKRSAEPRMEIPEFRLLVRSFFHRFFDNELVSPQGELQDTVIQILALLAAPGLIIPFYLMVKYGHLEYHAPELLRVASWADKAFFLTLSMVAIGFVTVLAWEALFPDRRDSMILSPLPVKARTVFAAKLAALLLFLLLFAGAVNLPTTLLYPLVANRAGTPMAAVAGHALAHLASTLAASACVFFFLLAVEGLLINLLPHRRFRRISVYIQSASLFLLLSMFLLLPQISSARWLRDPSRIAVLEALPPFWFLGLYETLLGGADPLFGSLAARAAAALALSAGGSLLLYTACYRRHVRRTLEAPELAPQRPGRVTTLLGRLANRLLVRRPVERAVFHFVVKTMARSQRHRLFLAGYLGVGLACVADSVMRLLQRGGSGPWRQPSVATLSAPLVLVFFVLIGMRVLFTVPAELKANWTFQLTEREDRGPYLAAARKAMLALGLGPVFLLLPIYCLIWDWPLVLRHALYCLLLSLLLLEGLLLHFRKIPFTCAYLPGKANLKVLWPFYCLAFSAYAYGMAALEDWMLRAPQRYAVFVGLATAGLAALIAYRWRLFARGFQFVYEDQPEPVVRQLNLREWPSAAADL